MQSGHQLEIGDLGGDRDRYVEICNYLLAPST